MKQDVIDRAKHYLLSITKKHKVAVFHDLDNDGLCSAAILHTLLQRLRGRGIDYRFADTEGKHQLTSSHLAVLKRKQVTHLITADLNVEEGKQTLKKASAFLKILVIDHHELLTKHLNNIVLYKPQLFSKVPPSRYCTSKLVYDLGMHLIDISDRDWLAAVGTVSDFAHQPWLPWLKKTSKKYKAIWKKDPFKTYFGSISHIINGALNYNSKLVNVAFSVLVSAKKPGNVLTSRLRIFHKRFDGELQRVIRGFNKINPTGDCWFYEVKSKYEVKGTASTILGKKYPHRTLILYKKDLYKNRLIWFSARRSDCTVPLNVILRNALKGLDGIAGGHIPAAGGHVAASDFPAFKTRLARLLEHHNS